jgi:hypothetical protein
MNCSTTPRAASSEFSSVRREWSKVLWGSLLERLACETAARCTEDLGLQLGDVIGHGMIICVRLGRSAEYCAVRAVPCVGE